MVYAVRLLPLGVPVAAGVSTTGSGAVALLALVGLVALLLVVRSLRLREHREGPPA